MASEAFYMYNSMRMRRVIITIVMALMGIVAMPDSATAQFDLSKIGSMLGGKVAKPTKSPYQTLAENAPIKSKIIGIWHYSDFDIEYLGNNAIAHTAISQTEYYLQQEIKAAGITSGCYYIALRNNGKGYFYYSDYTYESSYTYDPTTGAFATLPGQITVPAGTMAPSAAPMASVSAGEFVRKVIMYPPKAFPPGEGGFGKKCLHCFAEDG